MSISEPNYHNALQDFNEARRQASMQEILARLTGQPNELLSYEEVARKLKLTARSERGVQNIPLNAIVGSVGRYTDFTRTFLPRSTTDRERWARVKAMLDDPSGRGWPPIEVYKVGEVYFVLDGNHRVSVARQEGFATIEAHIIEVRSEVPITADLSPDDLIIKSEYADFLDQTNLTKLRPGADLSVTVPGQYEKLLEHIKVHQYFMGKDLQRDIPYPEAVAHWYDAVYMALIEPIRERGMLRWFPDRTETDLYLWVSENRAALEADLGWHIRPEAAINALSAREDPRAESELAETGQWRAAKIMDRYTEQLFSEILVSIGDSPASWQALEQAIIVAQREKSDLHGLHLVPPKKKLDNESALATRARFSQRCQEAGVPGSLAIEHGEVSAQVVQRALLADLVVLNVEHPPTGGLSSLGSGLRTIIWRSARPILTVPGKPSPLDRALVAFDGSLKSREALFVAAYIAEQWKTRLTVASVSAGSLQPQVQDYARAYLELHEVQADFVFENAPLDIFPSLVEKYEANLVVLGGYGGSAWQEVMVGSLVNLLLRQAKCPLLICR